MMNGFGRIKEFNERVREKIGWKIIDGYLLRKMLGTVVFAITLLMTIVIVFDVSENIQRFMSHNISAKEVIVGYYFNFVPYFINLFIPLFTFISVIWFTSKLSSRNEIISIFDNGISFNRMLVPYITGAVIIMLVSLVLANFVVPKTNGKLNDFKYQYFGRKSIAATYLHIKNSKNSYVFVERWDKMEEMGYNFTYEEFDNNAIRLKISAQTVDYSEEKKMWQLHRFTRREITPDKEEIITQGAEFDTALNILPRNLYQDAFVSETMSYTELRQFIREEKLRGSSLLANYQIEQHKRLANPLGILIMTLLGVSVSCRKSTRGVGVHVFIGMGLAFSFIFLQQVSTVFSVSGGLPPVLGTWFPNIIFLIITIVMLRLTPK
ncbi:MAG: LptF/LptG family permease [Bacteroidales bacterium]|nr:LptF/LptG family permease [Bacteroidales bacterium]